MFSDERDEDDLVRLVNIPGWTTTTTPSVTPEIKGVSSESSPSKKSQDSAYPSPQSSCSIGTSPEPSIRRLSSSALPPSPTLFSQHYSMSEKKVSDDELIIKLAEIGDGDWSKEKEQWMNLAIDHPVSDLTRITILDQLKLNKNKENIRRFVRELYTKATEVGEKNKPNEQSEFWFGACLAEYFIGDRGIIDMYHAQRSSLATRFPGFAIKKLDLLDSRFQRIDMLGPEKSSDLVALTALRTTSSSQKRNHKKELRPSNNCCCCILS